MEEVTRFGEGREVFVDTAAWVALFDPADRRNVAATTVLRNLTAARESLLTTDYVLDETVTLLRIRGGHARSAGAGLAILESRVARLLFLDEVTIRNAWAAYERFSDKSYSFTDVTSFHVMESLRLRRVFTFDRHFVQAGFQVLDAAGE